LAELLQLRLHRSELTYEVALSPYFAAVIDTPGKVADALASEFNRLDVSLSDIDVDDDGAFEDRGLTCELHKRNASVLLRADRFEIHFAEPEEVGDAPIAPSVWQVLEASSPLVKPKSHSLLFEMDCELSSGTYGAALQHFCMPPTSLPKGTETAVVYYLPRDSSRGFLDSSLVLNRSAEVEGGILLAATLVFEGDSLGRNDAVSAGRGRLNELLKSLNIAIGDR
jgi:hypothetical protein